MEMLFGDFRLRLRERELVGPGGPIELSSRSFDLLTTLLQQPNRLLDKAALFDAVWSGVVVEENTLQVHMSALRKALGPGFVATVHGRGYKYVGPPPRPDEAGSAAASAGRAGNIGRYRADCVARDAEIEAVKRLFEQHRLVSILGPGGVGKTTLAVAVAAGLAGRAGGGVWMVNLASLGSGEFIESTLIQALGVPFRAGSRALDSILDFLRNAEVVLLFDNCEHVRGAAARIIGVLLAEAPGVRILATSQIPLGLPDEHVFKLLPFAVDGDGASGAASAQFLAHCYAAFGEKLAPEELPIVERLCRRLDGVALALKMAAARAATVGLETVDRQLEQQLAGLAADWDPALARHRSLAASLAWSYDLLAPADQRTLRRLGVFHGSFSIDAVEAVADAGSEQSLAELVRRSLVVRDAADRSRYRLLESTRHFALDKLDESGEAIEARDRHAGYVMALFVDSIARWETLPDGKWGQTYRPDGDNLRAALAWTRSRADWPRHVELAAASYRYFIEEQLGAEGLETIEAGMSLVSAVPPRSAARVQLALGEICRFNAMDIRAHQVLVPALEWFRGSGDTLYYAQALVLLTWVSICFRAPEESLPLVAELDGLIGRLELSKVKSWGLVAIGIHMWIETHAPAGLARAEAGLAMHLDAGNPKGRFRSAIQLCEMLHQHRDTERALRVAEQIVPEFRHDGTPLQLCIMLTNIAAYSFALGLVDNAESAIREAARVVPSDGHWHWCLLQAMAELQVNRSAPQEAAMLLGFTDRCFEGWADGRQSTEQMQRDRLVAALGRALAEHERERLMHQGRALSLFEADHLAGFVGTERPRLKI